MQRLGNQRKKTEYALGALRKKKECGRAQVAKLDGAMKHFRVGHGTRLEARWSPEVQPVNREKTHGAALSRLDRKNPRQDCKTRTPAHY